MNKYQEPQKKFLRRKRNTIISSSTMKVYGDINVVEMMSILINVAIILLLNTVSNHVSMMSATVIVEFIKPQIW